MARRLKSSFVEASYVSTPISNKRYFDVNLTVRKLVMNRLGQLLKNFRRKLRQTYILPNQDTPSKLNEVPVKYSAILKAEDWVNFVTYTATEEYKIEKKEIEQDEEPTRGTLWLKGRVNKDGEYQDHEIRSVGDKLKETEDKIKEGTLQVDQCTNAMTLVLGKEKGSYARGVGSGVTYKRYFNLQQSKQAADERILLLESQLDVARRKREEKELLIKNEEAPEQLFLDVIRMDASIREENAKKETNKSLRAIKCRLWHLKKTTIIAEGTVYKSDRKIMLHNKALPKDFYKVSIDKSLVDTAFIPDVGSNGCTTVLDAVGGFVAWPKNQVVFYPKATPPSTIQMVTVDNKTAPKVQTKHKNFYVSSDAMQKEANNKRSQKALVY
ncbi:hypothetical protein Tco_1403155 [Tanacetum coccineum]